MSKRTYRFVSRARVCSCDCSAKWKVFWRHHDEEGGEGADERAGNKEGKGRDAFIEASN